MYWETASNSMEWTRKVTNIEVHRMANTNCDLLNHVKTCKLQYLGHVMRKSKDTIEGKRVMTGH